MYETALYYVLEKSIHKHFCVAAIMEIVHLSIAQANVYYCCYIYIYIYKAKYTKVNINALLNRASISPTPF